MRKDPRNACHAAYEDYQVRKYKVVSTEKTKTCIRNRIELFRVSLLVSRVSNTLFFYVILLFVIICFKVSSLPTPHKSPVPTKPIKENNIKKPKHAYPWEGQCTHLAAVWVVATITGSID